MRSELSALSLLIALGACGSGYQEGLAGDGPPQIPARLPEPANAEPSPAALPREGYDSVGYASWYGEELRGNATATGEAFAPGAITAAHRSLPLGGFAEVTALDTGRTILVRINDRGPHAGDRLIDLSRGAAQQLGADRGGNIPVRVRAVTPPPADRAALLAGQPASERLATPPGLLVALRKRLGVAPISASPPRPARASPTAPGRTTRSGDGRYQVQVAAFSSRDRAAALATRLGGRVVTAGSVHRVRLGPFADENSAARARDDAARQGYGDAQIVRE